MFSSELRDFLVELLTSWQVIAASVAVVLYIALVNYVTHFKTGSKEPKSEQQVKKMKVRIDKKKDKEDELQEEEA
jgi:LEA14-like dessication related protein